MYLALIILCVVLYYLFPDKANKHAIKQYIYIITCLLIIVSGLRHEAVGNDTYAYMQTFDKMAIISWNDIWENFWQSYLYPGINGNGKDPGQLVITKVLSLILPDSRFFLFVVAMMLLIPLGIFVYRNSESLETPCFFYVFYITMFYPYLPNSAVRQSWALAILLIGYLFLQKGKDKYFIISLLLATFIHKSIFIVVLILPFYYLRNTRLLYKSVLVLFIMMLFLYQYVGVYLSSQSEIYERYGTGEFYASRSAPYMVILMMLGLYFIGWLGINKDNKPYSRRLIYGGAALTLVWVVMVRLDPSLIRITAYFGPWMGVMIPLSLRLWRKRDYKIFFILILLIFIVRALITPDNYHFLWQEMKLHERY